MAKKPSTDWLTDIVTDLLAVLLTEGGYGTSRLQVRIVRDFHDLVGWNFCTGGF
jgi:hypothetical protein